MSARRNILVRLCASFGIGMAEAYALTAACTWVITAASLGMFLSFCMWFIAGFVFFISIDPTNAAIRRVLSDERIDGAIASTKAFFSRFATKA